MWKWLTNKRGDTKTSGLIGGGLLAGGIALGAVLPIGETPDKIPEPATVQMVSAKTDKGDSVNVYTVTTKFDAAREITSKEVETYQPIYDTLGKYEGTEKRQVIRPDRQVFRFDNEAIEGDVFHAVYMLNDTVLADVVFQVPKLPAGQVCKMNSVNDFTFDPPAKR